MKAHGARIVDWTAKGCRVALAVSVAAVAIGTVADFGYTVPLEVAIEREFSEAAPSGQLDARTTAALDAGDISLARGLVDLALEFGRPLPPETAARLAEAEGPAAVALRNAEGAARGFVTGEIDGSAALAGALAADLTVIGDLRDIARETAKIAAGEDHSALILGLAAAGIAATAATYASAGGASPIRVGVSILKAARRTGAMTAEFAADLGRRLSTGAARGGDEAAQGARRLSALSGAATEMWAVSSAVGAAETVRLMKYVRTVDDLPELRHFAERFGARSRAVAELTGRASLKAFRTTIRLTEVLLAHLLAIVAWFGSLVAGAVANVAWRGVCFMALRA